MDKREEKLSQVQNKVIIGVDVGKEKHWAVVRYPDGSLGKPFVIYTDGTGLLQFWQELESRLKGHSLAEVVVGMESTGHYWKSLACFLYNKEIKVVLTNPYHTKKYKEIDDNSPLKSDKKDAWVIADLVAAGKFMEVKLEEGPFSELRQLGATRANLVDDLRCAKTYGTSLLDQLFPEWTKVFADPWGVASMKLLEKAASPEEVKGLGLEGMTEVMKDALGRNRAKTRGKALLEYASKSAGISLSQRSMLLTLRQTLQRLHLLEKQLKEVESEMESCLGEVEYAEALQTLPNLGKITLANILAENGRSEKLRSREGTVKSGGIEPVPDNKRTARKRRQEDT